MKAFLLIFLSFLILSCHQQSQSSQEIGMQTESYESNTYDDEMDMEPPRTSQPPESPDIQLESGTKIIKNGQMSFEVNQLEKSKSKIDSLLSFYEAYYENESYNAYGNRISYSLMIRIPNTNFENLITELEKGIGEVKSKNISARDVTEEYVDISIRLENNLAYLKQYQSILQKASSIKEILEVQEKIRKIEEEIDSRKGRLKFLNNQVKYSTLNLEISELITNNKYAAPSFGRRIINAFSGGINAFSTFIVGLVNVWPFILLILLIIFFRKPIMRKIRNK